ncbi:hypothetical protein HY495_03750 [Candidatus Woesearchaeota archaeon]|nr:hypothetical protein [Candidatus Woesearchaeota archaeon]
MGLADRPKSKLEEGLRQAIETARGIERDHTTPWGEHIEAVAEALDKGDSETLRRYARGIIAPGFPYQSSVRLYIFTLDRQV